MTGSRAKGHRLTEPRLAELMAAYRQGDAGAFDGLYSELAPPLRRYLCMLTRSRGADDLLQETFLQLHRSRRTHMPGRPVLPWAFAIARHVYLTDLRKRTRLEKREVGPVDALPEIPVPPAAEGLADRDSLQSALGRLPSDQVEAITLHHVWGFSFEEIGAALGILAVTAKLRAFRGMRRLRQLLADDGKRSGAAERTPGRTLRWSRGKPSGRR